MAWRVSARAFGAALAVVTITTLGAARPAAAQDIERILAGIKLGSRGTTVLSKYGNPNYVIIGDVGIRQGPSTGAGTQGPGNGAPMPGSSPGPGVFGKPSGGGMGSPSANTLPPPPGFGGAPTGGGSQGGAMMRGGGDGGPSASLPGFGSSGAGAFGGGNTSSPFGQTVSPLADEQEVTWVYNRKVGNNVVSYEFLIGPSGEVTQIRVSGYQGGDAKTHRGIVLGSTYKDVYRAYGFPESHEQVDNVLVTSFKSKAHVSFQFLNQSGQTNAFSPGNKVIAITIAQVE